MNDSLSYIAGWFQCLDFWHYIFAVFVFFLFVFAVYPSSSLAIAVRVCIYLLFGVTYAVLHMQCIPVAAQQWL